MTPFYFVVETDDPRDEGFAFKDLDYYLEDFNNDMATEYRTAEDFNDGEEYRRIYTIKEISE
jgi:hypothetical protein